MENTKLMARLDISKSKEAAELELGDIVTISITGKVKTLRGPEEGLRADYNNKDGKAGKDKPYTYPGSIELEIESMKVEGGSDFSGMEDD